MGYLLFPFLLFDWVIMDMTCITAIVGAYYRGMFTANWVNNQTLTQILALALVLLAIQCISILLIT